MSLAKRTIYQTLASAFYCTPTFASDRIFAHTRWEAGLSMPSGDVHNSRPPVIPPDTHFSGCSIRNGLRKLEV